MNIQQLALIGNPNCGKTTLFNALTGSHQRVGNWPGVTVERKSGVFQHQQQPYELIDLPGTYNLTCHEKLTAPDEKAALDYLLCGDAKLIINVIDATNLERNLYLTTQLIELGFPMVVVLNMMDAAKKRGIQFNTDKLADQLGCPVVAISAHKKQGLSQLKQTIQSKVSCSNITLNYPPCMSKAISTLTDKLKAKNFNAKQSHYLALHLLENDLYAQQKTSNHLQQQAQQLQQHIENCCNDEPDIIIADTRYQFITDTMQTIEFTSNRQHKVTTIIDRVVLNRFIGIPIFLAVMYCMFLFAINLGGAFQDFFDIGSNTIFVNGLAELLTTLHFPVWLTGILSAGVGKGINTTITFIPVIGFMFLFLSFLEGSGYMSRAAFVIDRLMRALGLPGKSFVPLIVGFGCNVPAIMATRTLENKRDRILTIMMSPFMSCGARLAIYTVFVAAFFPKGGQNIVFGLYLLGILVAILTGFILRKSLLRGHTSPLIMEMPPYRIPTFKNLLLHTWHRLKKFLIKAGKYIIPVCILIGTLNAVTVNGKIMTQGSQHSVLAAIGKEITPIFKPMGIQQNNWPATVGLMTGTLAKEVVVASLNTLYTQAGHLKVHAQSFHFWQGIKAALVSIPDNLVALKNSFANPILAQAPIQSINQGVYGEMYRLFGGQAAALAYLIFILLYFPCITATSAMLKELNKRWTYFSIAWTTGLAYGIATTFYQAVTWRLHPLFASLWISGFISLFFAIIFLMRHWGNRVKA